MHRVFHNLLYVTLALVFVGLAGCEPSQSAPTFTPGPAPVTAVTLKAETVTLTRELPGRITPFLVAEVRPQVTGIVQDLLVNEGGMVEAGQPLYQLDDDRYRADYNSASAFLTRANVALEIARVNATRSEKLVETGMVSRQSHDNTIAMLHQAEADVGVARATVASTEVVLNYARISAPISGRVGRSSVTRGALVTAHQEDALVTVQQLDPIYIDLSQSASEMLELRSELEAGTLSSSADIPVTMVLENGAHYAHGGKLKFSEVSVDPSTGSYMLRVEVPNPDNLLLPGMYARALLSVGTRQNALLVPQQGIARDAAGNATAMIVGKDGKAEVRTVQVSRAIGNQWLVDSGLQEGDQVIIEGLQKIMPGAPVIVSAATAAR